MEIQIDLSNSLRNKEAGAINEIKLAIKKASQKPLPNHAHHTGLLPVVTRGSWDRQNAVLNASCPRKDECGTLESEFLSLSGNAWLFTGLNEQAKEYHQAHRISLASKLFAPPQT